MKNISVNRCSEKLYKHRYKTDHGLGIPLFLVYLKGNGTTFFIFPFDVTVYFKTLLPIFHLV